MVRLGDPTSPPSATSAHGFSKKLRGSSIGPTYSQRAKRRTRRKLGSPISGLPIELLCTIFKDCVPAKFTPSVVPWFAFSHVCQHWRAVALGCPELWARLDLSRGAGLAQAQIARSLSLPLAVKAVDPRRTACAGYSVPALARAAAEGPRIRSLTLAVPPPVFEEHIRARLYDMPRLESLSVRCSARDGVTRLPPDVARAPLPRLRRLRLDGCDFAWGAPLMASALTTLSVKNCFELTGASAADVLGALRRLPALEVLELDNAVLDAPPARALAPAARVHLPRLARLSLSELAPFVSHFLRGDVVFPAGAVLDLCSLSAWDDPEQAELGAFYAALAAFVRDRPPPAVLRHLWIGVDDEWVIIRLRASAQQHQRGPPLFELRFVGTPADMRERFIGRGNRWSQHVEALEMEGKHMRVRCHNVTDADYTLAVEHIQQEDQ